MRDSTPGRIRSNRSIGAPLVWLSRLTTAPRRWPGRLATGLVVGSLLLMLSPALALASGTSRQTARFALTGNASISDRVLAEVAAEVPCSALDSVCVDAMCRAIADHYYEEGFLDVKIACRKPDPRSNEVAIEVTEGPLSRLESVHIDVEVPADDQRALEAVFSSQIGEPFSRSGLEQGIEEVLGFFDVRGYPFASVQPEILSSGGGRVSVGLKVDKGPSARIGDVAFRGLSRTREGVALLETGLKAGEVYDGERVENARDGLVALRIFDQVSEPQLTFDDTDTTISLMFDVVEGRANLFEGLIAYSPSAEANRFVGSLYLEMRNIAGTLRRLRVLWNKPGTDRLSWSIDYREPRIFGKPFAVETGVFSDVIESSFARRKFHLGIAFRGEPWLELGIGGFLGTTKDRSEGEGEGDFTERGGSFDFRYDGREDPMNPRSGFAAFVLSEIASLNFEEESSIDRTLSGLDAGGELLGTLGFMTVALGGRFQGAFASEGEVPESHLIRLGGMRSLRGYPEEWFVVEQALVATVELRHVMGRNSRIYVFVDAAALKDGERDFGDFSSSPLGYGVGFMGGSRSGVFRLEIALGRDDSFSDAKLHLGLVQRF